MSQKKIKVVVVDDSDVVRMQLVRLLASDATICVIGSVGDGASAIEFIKTNPPDAIVMDIHMPVMDGFEATRFIMETQPIPIIVCTATADPAEMVTSFRALEAGAVACIAKPVGFHHAGYEASAANLVQTVKLMSEVKVVRRWARTKPSGQPPASASQSHSAHRPAAIQWVGIGASTGGPPVLQAILSGLPRDFPVPILVVQHIAQTFLPGLVQWLNQTTGLPCQIASHGIRPVAGNVYLAPDDFQMGIDGYGRIVLARADPENGSRPSVSYLFRSLAAIAGPAAVGVILTGMGKDGAAELKLMKDNGALTIAQDLESSVVHGMPGHAIGLGGVSRILPADQVAAAVAAFVNERNRNGGNL